MRCACSKRRMHLSWLPVTSSSIYTRMRLVATTGAQHAHPLVDRPCAHPASERAVLAAAQSNGPAVGSASMFRETTRTQGGARELLRLDQVDLLVVRDRSRDTTTYHALAICSANRLALSEPRAVKTLRTAAKDSSIRQPVFQSSS